MKKCLIFVLCIMCCGCITRQQTPCTCPVISSSLLEDTQEPICKRKTPEETIECLISYVKGMRQCNADKTDIRQYINNFYNNTEK